MKKIVCKGNVAFLITDQKTIKYLTGVTVEEGYLIAGKENACFTDMRYFYRMQAPLNQNGISAKVYRSLSDIKSYLCEKAINTLYVDYDKTSITEYKRYKTLGVKIKDGSKRLKQMKAVKKAGELKSIKKACQITEQAFYYTLDFIKEGVTERYIKDVLENKMLELGAEQTSFDTIVAFGSNSAIPHHNTGDTKLQKDQPVLIDTGCVVNGYCSDLTRTVFFGQPSSEFINAYSATLNANLNAIEKITNGIEGKAADNFARQLLTDSGYGENFTHSLGHGVGLEIHEYPSVSPKSSDKLYNNVVFTIEPGVYFAGKFGVRIEDTVVIRKGKVKRLFNDDKSLIEIN